MNITILGSGSPEGMPILTCDCKYCEDSNARTRPSVLIQSDMNILFDTSIDIRQQLLNKNIKKIDAIFITHEHFDHFAGLQDLEQLNWVNKANFTVYVSDHVNEYLQKNFPWIRLKRKITDKTIKIGDLDITPIKINHGIKTLGFIITKGDKKVVYIPDCKSIPEESLSYTKDASVLIFDGQYILGKYIEDDDHAGGKELLKIIADIHAKENYLIAFSEHWYKKSAKEAEEELPENVHIAFDGLKISI